MGCWGFVKIGFQSSVCRWRRRLRFIVSVRRRISGETGTTFSEFVGPAGRLFGAQHPPDLGLWFGPDQVTGSTPNSGRRQCRSHSRVSEKNFTFFFIGFSYFLQSISSSPACRNDQGDPVNSLEFLVSDVRRDGNGSIYHVGATMMTWLLDNNPKVKNKMIDIRDCLEIDNHFLKMFDVMDVIRMPAFTRCGKRISSIKRCTATWPSPKTSICIRWHRAGIYLNTSRLFRLWKRMGGAKRKEKREKGRKATGENGHDTVKNHVGCFF